MTARKPGPLEGVVIVDLSTTLPGPFATQLLADFGADVIKIENVKGGDDYRSVPPYVGEVSARLLALNRNKRSLSIDLKAPDGKEVFLKLARKAHVIVEQFRPGVVDRLGIGYEAVSAINPAIVYCSISGYGQESPFRNVTGHDANYLSLSGVQSLVGYKDGPPALCGPQLADLTASYHAAIGILIAVRQAERSGVGDYVDVSLFDGAMSLAQTAVATYLSGAPAPTRGSERHNGRYPWSGIYKTAEGGHITIAAVENHFYRNLCKALGREEWAEFQYAPEDRLAEIRAGFEAIFLTRTRDEWFELLRDRDVCIGPVLSIDEALAGPQIVERRGVITHEHPKAGPTQLLAPPIRMKHSPASIRTGAPDLGEHSTDILEWLGYGKRDVERLLGERVIRQAPDH